jgi:uncharacterized protein YjdB
MACLLIALIANCRDALAPTTDILATLAPASAWPSALSIAEIATVEASVTNASGAPILGVDLEWATSDSSIVTIARVPIPSDTTNDDRLHAGLSAVITTHAPGQATIVARLNRPGFANTQLEVPVTVQKGIWPDTLTVSQLESAIIARTNGNPNLFDGAAVAWQTNDPSVVQVARDDADPFRVQLTPRASGAVIITATVTGPRLGRAVFQLPVSVFRLRVGEAAPWDTLLTVTDSTTTLGVRVTDARGRVLPTCGTAVGCIPVQWRSTNTLAVQVAGGKLKALNPGGSEIVATAGPTGGVFEPSEYRAVVSVRSMQVVEAPAWPSTLTVADAVAFAVNVMDATSKKMNGVKVHWSSTNGTAFKVDTLGTVTALSAGSGQLVATVGEPPFQSSEHRANITVQALGIGPVGTWPDSLTVADTVQLVTTAALAAPGAPLTVRWSSTNTAVFTVDASGTVVALAQGTGQVVATIGDPPFQTSERRQTIKVVPLRLVQSPPWPTSIELSRDTTLGVVVRDAFGNARSGRRVQWRSSNESAFEVDPGGRVTPRKFGSGEVIVTVGEAPFQVTELRGAMRVRITWLDISAGLRHTCARSSDRTGYCWGTNQFGEMGTGDGPFAAPVTAPRLIQTLSRFDELSAGGIDLPPRPPGLFPQTGAHTCGRSGNSVLCWGATTSGQVGDGVGPCVAVSAGDCTRELPVEVTAGFGARVIHAAAGGRLTCAQMVIGFGSSAPGFVNCWGWMGPGSTGFGTRPDTSKLSNMVLASMLTGFFVGGAHACVAWNTFGAPFPASGIVKCFGENDLGQSGDLADGTGWLVLDQSGSPVGFPLAARGLFPTNLNVVAGGARHSCILNTAREVLCWGSNSAMQLGVPVAPNGCGGPPQPCSTRALSLTLPADITALTAGREHTCALATSGNVYCWGSNDAGQLGRGTVGGPSAVPTLVVGGFLFSSISAGSDYTCGVTIVERAAYCWGNNDVGQLGNGSASAPRPTPQRVAEPPF